MHGKKRFEINVLAKRRRELLTVRKPLTNNKGRERKRLRNNE